MSNQHSDQQSNQHSDQQSDTQGTDPWAGLDSPAAPNASSWVAQQLEAIDRAGTTDAAEIKGRPVEVLTMRGARSGRVLRVPLMRVEHDGVYAAVASKGGAPDNPQWYHNVVADPHLLLQDGTTTSKVIAREIHGAERDEWWPRCVAAFPDYADYQKNTDRLIPVFLLEPPA
ncbi:nitroreductase family deazaflavin-dependent oxidoreductase [Arsenicicoccus piscis]|uniref:nitroreductase family deazaflavin-dependent oxidoreductase n=1 Tax=Arsenicicoccus piscis TaxID=673954 RepID=UPI0030C69A48